MIHRAPARTAALIASLLLPVAALTACGSGSSSGSGTTITVYAAASLTDAFTKVGAAFEQAHPGVHVRFSFGGSSDLVSQLENGAPADVFASADEATMGDLTGQHLQAADPRTFATNTLEIATPPGNPAHITSFQDLARSGVKVVVCAAAVPCGAATQQMATKLGVKLAPVSEEQSVTDVLAKVTSGEADAGVVYVTDVQAAGATVQGVTFPQSSQVVNDYPIAPLSGSKSPTTAAQFVAFVVGSQGQQILAADGFGKP